MDLVRATNTPELLTLGGQEFPVRELKFKEWAPVQAWLLKHAPGPLARAAEAIQQLHDRGRGVDALTEELMLDHAMREAVNWPPRVGTRAWIAALDACEGGLAEVLRTVLATTVEGFDQARADALVEVIRPDEVHDLVNLSAYGMRPLPKSAGEPAPPTPPASDGSPG